MRIFHRRTQQASGLALINIVTGGAFLGALDATPPPETPTGGAIRFHPAERGGQLGEEAMARVKEQLDGIRSAHGGYGHNPARAGEGCAECDRLDAES